MSDDFIDFSYGFICECANLINNLYDYDNYYHIFNRYFGMYNYKND